MGIITMEGIITRGNGIVIMAEGAMAAAVVEDTIILWRVVTIDSRKMKVLPIRMDRRLCQVEEKIRRLWLLLWKRRQRLATCSEEDLNSNFF
jgi:hypothetical protein